MPISLGDVVARGSRSTVYAYGHGAVAKVPDPATPESWIRYEACESIALVSKMQPPFDGNPGDDIGLQIVGSTHVFRGDGSRIASATATLS